jgi:ABC-type branched-subunit amino acid transport system substrate-binding protein
MTRTSNRWPKLAAVLLALGLLAGACGGSSDSDDGDGGNASGEIKTGPGFDGTTIKVGVLSPLSGPVADPIGLPLTAGGDVYWEMVNAKGGVAGKYKVEVVKQDTQYQNEITKQKYTQIKNDVALFSQVLGTPPTQTILADLEKDGIVASPASLDAAWVRQTNLLPVGSTYQLQFINAAHYLVEDKGLKGKKFCALAIDSEYGTAGTEGFNFAAENEDFEKGPVVTFTPAATEYTGQITQLKNAGCAVVFLTSLPSQTGPIIGAAAQAGFTPQWVGQSPTWVSALGASAAISPVLQKVFLWTSEGTTWGDESVEGMKEMIDAIKAHKPDQKPDVYFSFGFAQAKAVHQLLEAAVENNDLSREGILDALSDLEVDFAGLLGDYTYGKPADRDPSREATIFKVTGNAETGYLEKVATVESDAAKEYKFE